jgi:hypothetical protein
MNDQQPGERQRVNESSVPGRSSEGDSPASHQPPASHRLSRLWKWLTGSPSRKAVSAAGAILLAAISGIVGSAASGWFSSGSSNSNNNNTASSNYLTIKSVSFSVDNGNVELLVSGTYNAQPGDDYLYAVARPSKVPFGTANWLVSEPVTPQNGQWTAVINLTTAESHQKMTVFAVLAGGCPPGAACAVQTPPDPEELRVELEQGGPQSAGYSTRPWVTSAAPAIRHPSPNPSTSSPSPKPSTGAYPASGENSFLNICEQQLPASASHCQCDLAYAESNIPFSDFVADETYMVYLADNNSGCS